jgi:hypothetical protein
MARSKAKASALTPAPTDGSAPGQDAACAHVLCVCGAGLLQSAIVSGTSSASWSTLVSAFTMNGRKSLDGRDVHGFDPAIMLYAFGGVLPKVYGGQNFMAQLPCSVDLGWPTQLSAYDYTRTLSKWDWAWEVLRRIPAYHEDYRNNVGLLPQPERLASGITVHRLTAPVPRAGAWGLSAFHRSVPLRSVSPRVLVARDRLAGS